ncbi:hypothetical protein GQ44DRAFT_620489 [Phaeosphaeriaceae sp. PMI808]|nr:hypothetical protein GQ44DRAFT_620489 [Phaeosphaeriaceae sp. PMI808]
MYRDQQPAQISNFSGTRDRNTSFPARQIQYRSYQQEIKIYHFRVDSLSVNRFRSLLRKDKHGYVDVLVSPDLLNFDVPDGDEIPSDRIEVGYLPRILAMTQGSVTNGSALGFRTGNNVIQWFCFDRPVEDIILNAWVSENKETDPGAREENKLFEFVASMPKGIATRTIKGSNEEHKRWHQCLWVAELARPRPLQLTLTWKNRENERRKAEFSTEEG